MAQWCELCRVPCLRLRHYYGVRLRKLAPLLFSPSASLCLARARYP